jgi:hypothetical protein
VDPPSSVASQIEEQKQNNLSGLGHRQTFASHRAALSTLLGEEAARAPGQRLCVLGAGNCYDLDLPALSQAFAEVHLVDLDRAALERAWQAEPESVRARLVLHGPLDLSGLHAVLEDWKAMRVTPQALMTAPAATSKRIASALPGPFDVVVSACLLSQLQLALCGVLGDRHQLFEAVRQIQNLIHLRSVARLLAPGGRALIVSDVVSDLSYPLGALPQGADLIALTGELVRAGNVIYAVNPELISETAQLDPYLAHSVEVLPLRRAWLWQNGPQRSFLVYALPLRRR